MKDEWKWIVYEIDDIEDIEEKQIMAGNDLHILKPMADNWLLIGGGSVEIRDRDSNTSWFKNADDDFGWTECERVKP